MEKNPEIQTWAERAEQEQMEIFQYFVPDGTLRSESDTTLSAFAQLAALRLNATRALISILDSANQYVLVEATRDSRLRRDRPATDEDDDLLLGRTTLTRSLGLCGHVLDNVDQHESELAGEKLWRPPYLPFMVDDVAVDEKLRDHPFVTSHPSVRFYAAMPICTTSGLRVGTISVIDERPRRELLGADEIEFLGDIGHAIMAHLETTRISDGHRRGEKMIRGLGVFMEGRTDLRDWWYQLGDSRHASGQQPAVRVHEDDGSTMKVEAAPANSEFADSLAVADRLLVTTPLEYTTAQEPLPSFPETTASRQPTPLAIPPRPSARAGSGPEHGQASLSEGHAQSPPPSRGQSSRSFGPGPMDGPRPISKKLNEMFSRAGHIIQEAIDIDGALFLDARINTPSERSESVTSTERGGSSRSSTNTSESSPGQAQEHVQVPCQVLSLWASERSSLHGDGASKLMPLAESFLLGLLNKYPQGHVFSPGEPPGPGHHKKEKGEAAALEIMLPGARSVVVVPLWDANAGRWFAAGCMWTVNPTSRVLTRSGDLNYLTAFGNSIMAEVARLDVVRTDRAKLDFISCISHELRSPLHGILASAELLHDTTVDLFQRGMIDTIERCGRTLLDTIQHVLDFAKINSFTKRGSLCGMSNLSVDVDLNLLTEEVVDSVFAGHQFQSESKDPSSPFAAADETGGGFPAESLRDNSAIDDKGRRSSNEPKKEPIDVILDITWRPNWFFRTESGAVRRVLMNLFGNALKYTDRGWVKVSLQAKDIDATKSTITITVTDSGRGIDPEYLDGALFAPFTQENSLNPGTGLGLSIVLQIVRSLRGRISITSEPGVGTQVVVTLVMKQVPPPHGGGEPRHFLAKNLEAIRSAREKTEGLRIGLLGFGSPDVNMRRPENTDRHAEWNSRIGKEPSLPLLRQSIESAATQWFGMKITPPSTWTFSPPDIHIVNGRAGIRDAFPGCPIIALCSHEELYREYSRRATRGARRAARELAHFVSKPCGPHKLAEAFDFCLQNISRSSAVTSPSMGAPSGAFSSPQNSLFAQTPDNYATDHSRAREDYFSGPEAKAETLTQQAAAAATAESSSSVPGERKPRLLLVEDNKINLYLLSTFIGRCSFDYSTAENGLEAVQAFDAATEHPYDIILMDISMPIMDGTEATRKIRKLEQAYPTKRPAMVIALTGLGSANSQKDAFDSGVNMFLTKPVRLKDLKKILEDWDPDGMV
ncbi:hypothetical protein QBC34DRAFT_402902 [Podospora aff. communis PSN243]|uniref:histidine kinase n=1 Tax=Podospora aff. communis PSN243 TaxID=3040156 RepID=A0AAV9GRL4_9PEZI|nr:hypothetical protein QBC34DRAFT_402902 [Podospora aff. communis PSN243]